VKRHKVNRTLLGTILLFGTIILFGFSCRHVIKSGLPTTSLKLGSHEIFVEVANKETTRETGLMFRHEMDWDNGMLFVFDDSAQRYFWMKNTLIPLSIAFIDEKGIILNILEMPPQTEQTFPSNGPAKFALEMNAGWYTQNGLKPGDRVEGLLNAPNGD
jgi:uncharacterized membrane protein (UPF0127 family)